MLKCVATPIAVYVFTSDFEGRGLLFSRYGYFDDVVEFVFEDAVGFFDFG